MPEDDECKLASYDITICSGVDVSVKIQSAYWFLQNAYRASTAPRGVSKTELRNRGREALAITLYEIDDADFPEIVPVRDKIIKGLDRVDELRRPAKEKEFPAEFLHAARSLGDLRDETILSCLNTRLKERAERAKYRRERYDD